jgi:hypothetical protein
MTRTRITIIILVVVLIFGGYLADSLLKCGQHNLYVSITRTLSSGQCERGVCFPIPL